MAYSTAKQEKQILQPEVLLLSSKLHISNQHSSSAMLGLAATGRVLALLHARVTRCTKTLTSWIPSVQSSPRGSTPCLQPWIGN
jgi:hypothetical protein